MIFLMTENQCTNLLKSILLLLYEFGKFALCFVMPVISFRNGYKLENRASFNSTKIHSNQTLLIRKTLFLSTPLKDLRKIKIRKYRILKLSNSHLCEQDESSFNWWPDHWMSLCLPAWARTRGRLGVSRTRLYPKSDRFAKLGNATAYVKNSLKCGL